MSAATYEYSLDGIYWNDAPGGMFSLAGHGVVHVRITGPEVRQSRATPSPAPIQQAQQDSCISPLRAAPAGQHDAGAMGWRSDLQAIDRAMQHMGDALNGMDAVEAEDEEAVSGGFEAMERLLTANNWVLVPVKPTPKMVDATFNDRVDNESHNKRNKRIYAAMIAAAPTLPEVSAPAGAAKSGITSPCKACNGEGVIHTGIDEAPTSDCRKCDGSGLAPTVKASQSDTHPSATVRNEKD